MKFCLWGHHRGYVQVGSRQDRYLQAQLRITAAIRRSARVIEEAFLPAILEANKAMAELSRAFAKGIRPLQ